MRAMPVPGMLGDPTQQYVNQEVGPIGLQASFPSDVYGPPPQGPLSGLGGIGEAPTMEGAAIDPADIQGLAEPLLNTGAPFPTESLEAPERPDDASIVNFVIGWKNKLKSGRKDKQLLWDECWRMYRGQEDWSDKDDWQSKVFLPKSWAAVERAASTIKRLLQSSQKPWQIEAINPDDLVMTARADQMTDLTRVFMEKANYQEAFAEALKVSFIIGFGVIKCWWDQVPRQKVIAEGDSLKRITYPEGQLIIKAVDPYNFWWLPGSTFDELNGTIEEIEVPKWKLLQIARTGKFDEEQVRALSSMKITEEQKRGYARFGDRSSALDGPSQTASLVKLTEYYGPIIIDDEVVEEHGHVVIANDTEVLQYSAMTNWDNKPPYIAFSPISFPLRPEGTGLIEMVRAINQGINKIANLSIDTLIFRLLPVFEVMPDVYENKEDFDTGLFPGKIFRRNDMFKDTAGIRPIPFEDVSGGAVQVSAQLDRSHQEGSMVSEIQQALPRYRGVQTATEIEAKQANQESFFGAMASDVEARAIKPLVEKALDLLMQFIATSSDPRIPTILGVGAKELASMSREKIFELVQGDYDVKVGGITEQLDKANTLQNLVQFMNIVGQNPQAWMPYINQDQLLRRIVESFRPTIRDIDNIVTDPGTAEARRAAMVAEEQLMPQVVGMVPQLIQSQNTTQQAVADIGLKLQEMEFQKLEADRQAALEQQRMAIQQQQLALQAQQMAPQPPGGPQG